MDLATLNNSKTNPQKPGDLHPKGRDETATSKTDVTVVVKKSTMSKQMEKHAIWVAFCALSKFMVEKDAAKYIKQEFDQAHGKQWHCVVGQNFGCYVSHHLTQFTYFYINAMAVMLYKTTDIVVNAGNHPSSTTFTTLKTSQAVKTEEKPNSTSGDRILQSGAPAGENMRSNATQPALR